MATMNESDFKMLSKRVTDLENKYSEIIPTEFISDSEVEELNQIDNEENVSKNHILDLLK